MSMYEEYSFYTIEVRVKFMSPYEDRHNIIRIIESVIVAIIN